MSRLWLALVALLSALSPPPSVALGTAPATEQEAPDDDDEGSTGERHARSTSGVDAVDARGRLAVAGLRVEDWIAQQGLSNDRAQATRAAFAGRLLWNLSTLREEGAVSEEEARHVRSFARWMLDRAV